MVSQGKCVKLLLLWTILMALVTENEACGRSPPPDTTNPTFTNCPGGLGNQYTTGAFRTVTWTTPTATDNSGSVTVSRVSGLGPGSTFSVSTTRYTIQYRATDAAGNYATCSITFRVVGIRCATLGAPSRGTVGCTNTNFISSVCTYSCDTGYRLVGYETRTCSRSSNTGYWTGSNPFCERVTCDPLDIPINGALSCTDGSYYGSSCTFSCDYGYTLEDSQPTWTCLQSGQWSGTGGTPDCIDNLAPSITGCPTSRSVLAPPLETSAIVMWSTPSASDNSGEAITVVLEQGSASRSTFEEGDHLITYSATDSAQNKATCSFIVTVEVVYCPAQAAHPPLQVSCPQSNIRGSECTFSCSTGYSLQGQETQLCVLTGSTGMWNSITPSCQITQCNEPPSLANGGMTDDCSRDYGSSCHFECHVGYEINNDVLTCVGQSGSSSVFWNGESPVCSRIYCTKPSLSAGLQITVSSQCPSGRQVPSGNQCHFICSEGYHLQGSEDLTCQEDHTWSSTIPTCQLISCAVADLPVPVNAFKQGCTVQQVNYGTVCTLSCQEGYEPTGSGEMTCSDDGNGVGTWSGDSVECTLVTCSAPIPVSTVTTVNCLYNGESTVTSERQKYSTSCNFQCEDGYSMVEGSYVRVCLATGEWNGIPVLCRDITPPDLTCPEDIVLKADPRMTSSEIQWSQWEPILASDLGMSIEATLYSINSDEVGPNRPSSFSEGSHTLVYQAEDASGNEVDCSFSVTAKVCRCPPLSIPENSIVSLVSGVGSCHGGVVYGSMCTITCELGYTLSTGGRSLNRTCDISVSGPNCNAMWSGPGPVCEIVMCDVPDVTNGLSDCPSPTVAYLTSCEFSCNPGYRAPFEMESYLRTCQADSQWSGEDFQCTDLSTCPARLVIPYGSVSPSECSSSDFVQFDLMCEFTCQAGFRLEGPGTVFCNTDGNWSPNGDSFCVDIQAPTFDMACPYRIEADALRERTTAEVYFQEPIPIDNSGNATITRLDSGFAPGSEFPEGDTRIRYKATDVLGLTSFCDLIITVNVLRCNAQQPPLHGSISGCADSFIGSECLFTCDVGYYLMGTSSLHCELTSEGMPAWNDVTPTCLLQTCPSLQIPEFASLSGCDNSPVPFGSICTFSCEPGYTGIGESMKSCLEEGEWSSTSFVCERLPCKDLSEPSSITILPETCLSNPLFSDVCTLECMQSGFNITPPGLKEVTCSSDQTWTGEVEQAQCVDLELPVFEDCPSDIVAFASKSSDKANVEWSVVATDNDPSQEPVVTCNPQSGILTIGVHVVRCSALDEAGNEASCQFRVEVKARQCQPLTPPAHGVVMDTCDTTYGSTCHIECSEGYLLVGSSIGNCEFDGTDMFWQFENEPLCITTSCNPLDVPDQILFSPASCTGSGMVHDGTVCTMSCDFLLTLETEVESFTCLKGEWNHQPDISSIQCKDEVPPTLTYCPPHIMTTRTQSWGVEESFVYPSAEDNFDMELQVTVDPLDLTSPYTFTSDTTCTYAFTDDAGNSVSCVFQIDITNDVQPVITSCPTGSEVNTSGTVGLVHYEKPSYLPMPGIDLVISCNVPDSPVRLPVGDNDIICHVTDPASGLQAECRMSFKVTHKSCLPLNSPMNGALACDIFADGRYCSVLCEDGYDIPGVLTGAGIAISLDVFICGTSGSWHPQQSVPDCSEPMSARRNLPLMIMYYPSPCSEADASSIDTIASQFLEILEQSDFESICADDSECSVDNVEVSCGVKNERRRRSIPDQSRPKPDRGSGGPTTVSMVLRLTDTMKPGESDEPEGQNPHQVLHNLAHHIHSHVKHHFSGADGNEKEGGIPVDAEHQRLKPNTTLLFGDVLAECNQGYYLDKDGFKCIPCPAGYYLDVASEICTPCDVGSFQDDQAQTDCKPCKNGTSTIDKGATHADQCKDPCPAGHFSKSGLHPCALCPPGYYQPHPQRTTCRRCRGNTTTTMYGATSINSCHIVN